MKTNASSVAVAALTMAIAVCTAVPSVAQVVAAADDGLDAQRAQRDQRDLDAQRGPRDLRALGDTTLHATDGPALDAEGAVSATKSKPVQPGKSALEAEIEAEWVLPVNPAIGAASVQVFRRHRTERAQAPFDPDAATFEAEVKEPAWEASHASGAAETGLQTRLLAAKANLDGALHRTQQFQETLKQATDAKAKPLKLQLGQTRGDGKARTEDRLQRVNSGYQARGARLSQAHSLTRQAWVA